LFKCFENGSILLSELNKIFVKIHNYLIHKNLVINDFLSDIAAIYRFIPFVNENFDSQNFPLTA